jgi:hypothetical protein
MEIMPVYPTNLIKKNRFCNSRAPYYFAVLPELCRGKTRLFHTAVKNRGYYRVDSQNASYSSRGFQPRYVK